MSEQPKEGSLDAPTRHALDWQSDSFYDMAAIEDEMERVFDICHGCRRCFNLCDSFPQLFDLIDESETGELDSVDRADYKPIADACTLCDMCFMTKCPYVPPHEFDLDFPHLILRYRAAELKAKGGSFTEKQLAKTDRNGKALSGMSGLANWASKRGNGLTRPVLEAITGIDRDAGLPEYSGKTFEELSGQAVRAEDGAASGRKVALYTTCMVNYNNPGVGEAAEAVLAKQGVEVTTAYPGCCGMPHLEHGDIAQVASQAEQVAAELVKQIDAGYDIVTLTASCGLMLKFEWPLILPDNEDVLKLAANVYDISEYLVGIAKKEGLAEGLSKVEGGVTVHLACHARAQNVGPKSAELLRNIPETDVTIVERCSGHGGTFGIMKETRPLAQKVARNTVNAVARAEMDHLCSDCPLACKHVAQELEGKDGAKVPKPEHPIEIFARAYGL